MRRLAAALLAVSLNGCGGARGTDELTPLRIGGEVDLLAAGGRAFRLADHPRDVKLLFFGYASCPDACPTALGRVASVTRGLGDRGDHLLTVLISVDPERDSPERLDEFLSFFGVHGVGVTGPPERVAAVAEAYGAHYEKVESDSAAGYLMDHSTYLYLLDRENRVRRIVRTDDPVEKIVGWVEALLAERGD